MVAVIAIQLSATYIYYGDKTCKAVLNDTNYKEFMQETLPRLIRWVNLAVFTVVIIIASILMMREFRLRLNSMYREHGCKLWTIYIIQAISFISMTAYSIL